MTSFRISAAVRRTMFSRRSGFETHRRLKASVVLSPRMDRMTMTGEARRNATLREVDRHLGRRLRQAILAARGAGLK
jgi:hypothetical protein